MTDQFYQRNDYLLNHEVNWNFEDILWSTDEQFVDWCRRLRETVVYAWDTLGIPPVVGIDKADIIHQMQQMSGFPVYKFLVKDELTGEENVIRNTSYLGNCANAWFPTMMKTKINYNKKLNGRSIYDYFADPALFDTFCTYARRHFKRDSFYHYSQSVKVSEGITNARAWLHHFYDRGIDNIDDFWIAPVKADREYSGYSSTMKDNHFINIPRDELDELTRVGTNNKPFLTDKQLTNVNWDKHEMFQIRAFKYRQKLFPIGFKAFRVSYCQYAVNFPPLTAKYLYERFTDHIADQDVITVYDPSAGWGGRILGAMAVRDDRTIHYVGTDPNTDHTIRKEFSEMGLRGLEKYAYTTKYQNLAEFFNNHTGRRNSVFSHQNTFEILQKGSEVIGDDPNFMKYKGKIDLIFTSPPYFAKEGYSDDPTQSYKKFSVYDSWVEGFLRPTLVTCVDYLRSDRFLLWNIADAVFSGERLPLEDDSRRILESLGMEYVGVLKMALAQMPGSGRVVETGETEERLSMTLDDGIITEEIPILETTTKNSIKVNGKILKYEPVFIFRKP